MDADEGLIETTNPGNPNFPDAGPPNAPVAESPPVDAILDGPSTEPAVLGIAVIVDAPLSPLAEDAGATEVEDPAGHTAVTGEDATVAAQHAEPPAADEPSGGVLSRAEPEQASAIDEGETEHAAAVKELGVGGRIEIEAQGFRVVTGSRPPRFGHGATIEEALHDLKHPGVATPSVGEA